MSVKWKVYLSSTYLDLADKRKVLNDYIDKQLHGRFELTTVMEKMYDDGSYTDLHRQCEKAVRECDIYILIKGNGIGSYIPDSHTTFTEHELDTAIALGKQIHVLQLEVFDEKAIGETNLPKHREILSKFENKDIHLFKDLESIKRIFLECLAQYFHKSKINFDNPYKGLEAFNVEDGDYFFGRTSEVEACIDKIILNKIKNKNNFISVIGNSGIGKTSFVQAGLLFRLKNHKDFKDYLQITCVPGNQPFSNLSLKLKEFGLSPKQLLHADSPQKIILFINQFEEIISQCNTAEEIVERKEIFAFFDALTEKRPFQDIIVIITFRSDFYSALANFDFIQNQQTVFALSSLDYSKNTDNWEKSIKEIICNPALLNGVIIEKEVVSQLINQLKEVDGSLPILQFTLNQIWNTDTIADGKITSAEYNDLSEGKGIEGIIEIHAEKLIDKITLRGSDLENEKILKSIFVNLVEVTDSLSDVRKTIKKEELFQKLVQYPQQKVDRVYNELIGENGRLLVETEDVPPNINIIHEVLIRKWKRLKGWIDERREALEYQLEIKKDCTGRSFYNSKELRQAKNWIVENPDLSDKQITAYIQNCKKRIQIQKMKILGMGALVFIITALLYHPVQNRYFLYNLERKENKKIQDISELVINQYSDELLFDNLKDFKSLKKVRIENINLETIPFFDKIKNINTLEILNNGKLVSIKGIDQISRLKSLTVKGNDLLKNLDGLKNITSLKSLSVLGYFSLDKMQLSDSLESLEIGLLDSKQAYLRDISHFSNLSRLSIKYLNVKDFEEIKHFKSLRYLSVEGDKKIVNIEGLRHLRDLNTLTLSGIKKLSNIKVIGDLKELKVLTLSYSKHIVEYPELNNINKLVLSQKASLVNLNTLFRKENNSITSLVLHKNGDLEKLDGIYNLKKLTHLEINDNDQLKTLDGISKLEDLKTLKIVKLDADTDFKDLYNIKNLDFLHTDIKIDSASFKNRPLKIFIEETAAGKQ